MKEKLNISLEKEIKDKLLKLASNNGLKPSHYITLLVLKEINRGNRK